MNMPRPLVQHAADVPSIRDVLLFPCNASGELREHIVINKHGNAQKYGGIGKMIVIFLRGLPGAGKTSLANELVQLIELSRNVDVFPEDNTPVVHIEADKWMVNEKGEYDFDWRKLADVHDKCHAEYAKALKNKVPYIIISNTSAEGRHIEAYQQPAIEAGYRFTSLIVENRHGKSSVHGVPDTTMENIKRKFDVKL